MIIHWVSTKLTQNEIFKVGQYQNLAPAQIGLFVQIWSDYCKSAMLPDNVSQSIFLKYNLKLTITKGTAALTELAKLLSSCL